MRGHSLVHTVASALAVTLLVASLFISAGAYAQPAGKPAPQDTELEGKKEQARALFTQGIGEVQKFQWSEALSFFEQSHKLYGNAVTTLNVGICERALGRYVRAGNSLRRALKENDAGGGTVLSESSLADAKGYIAEIDKLIVHANVTIEPSSATISVDGRPIAADDAGGATFAAGVAPPGPGAVAPATKFELLLDPGNHVFVLNQKGFSDAVVNETLSPGDHTALDFVLKKLPATIKISSTEKDAIVHVGALDVGPVPVDVKRPAGAYKVVVVKEGFLPYETTLSVKAGEETKINAALKVDKPSVATRWWFWTSIVAGLGTVGVVTYFAARPAPEPPPYDGGTTGWIVQPSGFKF